MKQRNPPVTECHLLAYLTNFKTKQIQYAAVVVEECTLQIYEGKVCGLAKETTYASSAEANAAAEALIARRAKTGWQVAHRIETPWIAWVRELERLWTHVIADAKAANVPMGPLSHFRRAFPTSYATPELLAKAISAPDYADLVRVSGHVRLHFVLGDANLRHEVVFRIGALGDGRLWARNDSDDGGKLEGLMLVSRVDGEPVPHASADAFRAWFPRHVRDDVMSFVIAELAR